LDARPSVTRYRFGRAHIISNFSPCARWPPVNPDRLPVRMKPGKSHQIVASETADAVIRQDQPTTGMSPVRCGEISADAHATASLSASLRRERVEHRGWADGQVSQASPGRRTNGVADGGRDYGRARLAEADRGLGAVDELDVELRHVADPQRRIAVEVRVLHLAPDELG